jgi:AraC family transcriptional regulator
MITNELVIKSIDYIMQHLDDSISIEDVANHCHLSKYYFCRVFKAETGESIYAFIKRLKVEQSAFRLKVEKNKSITDIGYNYGYSPSNYSSLFKQHNNVSPAEFRKGNYTQYVSNPFYTDKLAKFQSFEEYNKQVQIQQLDDFLVIYERYIGNYIELEKKWRDFTEKYKDYLKEDTLLIERSYADPSVAGINQCLYDMCMTVDKNYSFDNVTTVQGGKFAVYRFEGLVQDIFTAFQGLFNVWLSDSGYEMNERYGLNIYRAINWDNMHVVMDMCIPIK